MSKAKKIILPVLMIFTIFCLGFSPAQDMSVQAKDSPSVVVVSGKLAKELVNATLRAVKEGEVENVAPVSAFDLEGSSVYTVGGGVTVVTVPLHGDYSLPSNITVFFDEDNTVLQTNEMLVTKNDLGTSELRRIWMDHLVILWILSLHILQMKRCLQRSQLWKRWV